jgi:hypothetical protein
LEILQRCQEEKKRQGFGAACYLRQASPESVESPTSRESPKKYTRQSSVIITRFPRKEESLEKPKKKKIKLPMAIVRYFQYKNDNSPNKKK